MDGLLLLLSASASLVFFSDVRPERLWRGGAAALWGKDECLAKAKACQAIIYAHDYRKKLVSRPRTVQQVV